MADPFGIPVGRNIGGFGPGPSLADILTREAQSQGRPAPAFPTPAPEPQSALARAMKDHAGYMERGGSFGTLFSMLPHETRRTLEPWAGLLNPLEWTPGPGIQQMVESSGDLTRATLAGQPMGMLNALGGMTLGAIGAVPGGRPAREAAKLFRATRAAEKAGLATDQASRLKRMAEQGYTPNYWRGGQSVANGPWYGPSRKQASDYARRHGDQGEVRKYALDEQRFLKFQNEYGPNLFRTIAKEVESYNPVAAKEWRKMADEGDIVSGADIWQMLQHTSNGAEALLKRIGFTGVKSARETYVLDMGVVRDQKDAMFNPAMKGKINPFYGLLPAGVVGGGVFGTGRNDEDLP